MSVIGSPLIPPRPAADPAEAQAQVRPRVRARVRPGAWAIVATVMLVGSGMVRLRQDQRLADAQLRSGPAPFPLRELATEIPGWHYQPGLGEQRLDPEVARIAGSSDHIIRSYVDDSTGVVLTILVIYGDGQVLSSHVPEVCYPNVGYKSIEAPVDRRIPLGRGAALFRSVVFAREAAVGEVREEVFYSFRHDGRWYPDAAIHWKQFRYNPSMIKVQVQRRMARQERRNLNNPTEQFLARFLPDLERQLARAETPLDAGGR